MPNKAMHWDVSFSRSDDRLSVERRRHDKTLFLLVFGAPGVVRTDGSISGQCERRAIKETVHYLRQELKSHPRVVFHNGTINWGVEAVFLQLDASRIRSRGEKQGVAIRQKIRRELNKIETALDTPGALPFR